MLPGFICYSCKSPNDLFCKKSEIKLNSVAPVCSHHDIILRYHSNFQNNWSRERPWNHLAPVSRGQVSAKKGHDSAAELESNPDSTATVQLLKGSKNKRKQTKTTGCPKKKVRKFEIQNLCPENKLILKVGAIC